MNLNPKYHLNPNHQESQTFNQAKTLLVCQKLSHLKTTKKAEAATQPRPNIKTIALHTKYNGKFHPYRFSHKYEHRSNHVVLESN